MARAGTFGGSLDPFGGGSLGGFSAYDIGSNLAELELYRVEVAWGNGTATDEQYVEALIKARDATSPETRDRESAQNRLDDAMYRIGRSKADEQGLDALIAFDQAALAKMNPDNVRFRSVSDSLDAELAERRSKDYGELVRRYNDGEVKTQTLVDWVQNALRGLDSEDPDYLHWTDTADDLADRLRSEEDERVYQDYQQRRMSPEKFLAYLTDRRNAFDPQSPQYEDWDRRLEDATDQVKEDRLARQDSAFFNRYEEGKVSDTAYLAYLQKRVAGMESDDPQLGEWKHRLHQTAFSIAEDKLRFAVERNKAPESKLRAFYVNYRKTLNPGSAEYRQITRAIMSLGGGGGGGGGGGRSGGSGGGGGVKGLGTKGKPKLINPNYTLTNIVPLLTIDVRGGSDKQVRTATKALELNTDSLQNALQRGDSVWVFQDPRKPASFIPGKYPDGSPMLDGKGKPVMVPGSAYLPVTNEAYTNLLGVQTDLHYKLAGKALANHDAAGYYYQLKLAGNIEDRARRSSAQAIERDNRTFYQTAQDGIDLALKVGDYATAVNLAVAVQSRLDSELGNPMLDDTRRTALERIGEKIGQSKILPVVDPFTGQRSGGAIDIENSTVDAKGNFTSVALLPGWHQTLDNVDARGSASWGLTFDEKQNGSWEDGHLTVHTSYGGRVVTGEVERGTAPTNSSVFVKTPEGYIKSDVAAEYIHYVDENGKTVKAYSLDGVTWVRSMTGAPPSVEVNVDLELGHDDDGNDAWVDAVTKEVVFSRNQDGSWAKNDSYFSEHSDAVGWYGQGNIGAYQEALAAGGEGFATRNRIQQEGAGAPGQWMQFATLSDTGALNFTGAPSRADIARAAETARLSSMAADYEAKEKQRRARDAESGRLTGLADDYREKRSNKATTDRLTGQAAQYEKDRALRATTAESDRWTALAASLQQRKIDAQLPANTPARFDGEGFRRSPATPPSLRPTGKPVLPGATRTAALPATPVTPIRPLAKKRPTPKPPTGRPLAKKRPTPKPPATRKPPTGRLGSRAV